MRICINYVPKVVHMFYTVQLGHRGMFKLFFELCLQWSLTPSSIEKLHIFVNSLKFQSSTQSEIFNQSWKFTDHLKTFQTIWKVSKHMESFQTSGKFWDFWKFSRPSRKYPTYLESLQTIRKVSRLSWKFPNLLESFQIIRKVPDHIEVCVFWHVF